MRKLETRNKQLGISKRSQPKSLVIGCGQAAHKPVVSNQENVCIAGGSMKQTHNPEYKAPYFSDTSKHLGQLLYTTYTQLFSAFLSLESLVVHIIHRAYKNDNNIYTYIQ
jgi:hypothetical protein